MKLVYGILAKEAHIATYGKREVIGQVLLLEHHFVAESLTEPCDIFRRGETIEGTREQHRGDVIVLDGHERHLRLSIDFSILDSAVIVSIELATIDHLSVVCKSTPALARWLI